MEPDPQSPNEETQDHKKIAIIITGFAILALAYYLVASWDTLKGLISPGPIDRVDVEVANSLPYDEATFGELLAVDSDKDGIPDWREQFLGSDPLDPLSGSEFIGEAGEEIAVLNQTDILTRDLFTIISAMQATGTYNETSRTQLSSEVTEYIRAQGAADIYAPSDLVIVENSNSATFSYLASFPEIVNTESLELDTFINILEAIDTENEIPNVSSVLSTHKEMIDNLTLLPVPEELSTFHIKLINAISAMSQSLEDLSNIYSDPVIGLRGLSNYQNTIFDVVRLINDISAFYEE